MSRIAQGIMGNVSNSSVEAEAIGYTALFNSSMENFSFEFSDWSPARKGIGDYPSRVIALTLSSIAILANGASLAAISQTRAGTLNANMRLIINLSISDILISVSTLSLFLSEAHVSPLMKMEEGHTCLYVILRALYMMSHVILLLTLLGLAIDHYIAIIKPLTHPVLMSRRRVNLMILLFWVIAILSGFSDFFMPSELQSYCEGGIYPMFDNYCGKTFCTKYDPEYIVFILAVLIFITMTYLYTKIYLRIHKYQNLGRTHYRQILRKKRGLLTTLLILGTFMLCWLPYCLMDLTSIFILHISQNIDTILQFHRMYVRMDYYLYDLLLVNCVCDPVIYATRMREVQHGYRRLRELCLSKKKTEAIALRLRYTINPRFQGQNCRHTSSACSTSLRGSGLSLTNGNVRYSGISTGQATQEMTL